MDDDATPAGDDGVAGPDDRETASGGEATPSDEEAVGDEGDVVRRPLEPGSPSLESAAFVLLGMATALAVWLLLLP